MKIKEWIIGKTNKDIVDLGKEIFPNVLEFPNIWSIVGDIEEDSIIITLLNKGTIETKVFIYTTGDITLEGMNTSLDIFCVMKAFIKRNIRGGNK